MHSSLQLLLIAVGIAFLCEAAPRPLSEQVVLTLVEQSLLQSGGGHSKLKAHYNLTFDDIKLGKKPKQKLEHLHPLEFVRYDVVNTSLAVEHDLMSQNDTDCAVVGTNTIFTAAGRYGSPSRVELDPVTAERYNVSEFFDLKGMTFKPLGPTPLGITVDIDAWRIKDGKALHVYSAFTWWGRDGFLPPAVVDFPRFWPGWGVDVNMVEISARSQKGKPWQLCVGRIELELKERRQE